MFVDILSICLHFFFNYWFYLYVFFLSVYDREFAISIKIVIVLAEVLLYYYLNVVIHGFDSVSIVI